MADQVWQVAVTPAQRFILLQLSHAEGQKVKGQRSRVYRRFNRFFGLVAILDAAEEHKGVVSKALRISRSPALFTLTAENVDYALELAEVERNTIADRTIGPLFDALEDLKAGREPAASDHLLTGATVPPYDPAAEDWAPEPPPKAPQPIPERIAAYLRAEGHPDAAELVDRGGWDKPAPTPNGTPAPQGEGRPEA